MIKHLGEYMKLVIAVPNYKVESDKLITLKGVIEDNINMCLYIDNNYTGVFIDDVYTDSSVVELEALKGDVVGEAFQVIYNTTNVQGNVYLTEIGNN